MSQADLRGKFVWHELMTPDVQAAAAFYSNVLPWTIEASTVPGYTLWMNGSAMRAGLMPQPSAVSDRGTPPNWLVYIATPEVDSTAEAAQRLGGKLLKAPTDIPGIGRFAVLSDPLGAAFALFTSHMSTPGDTRPVPAGRFSWHELATTDPHRALAFYAQLFGWTGGATHDMGAGGPYQIIEHAGIQIGGMHVLQDPSKPPRWLSYVCIEHIEEVLEAVRAHGGRVLRGPHVVPGGERVAHIMDPQGGTIALHEPAQEISTSRRRPAKRAVKPRAVRARAGAARAVKRRIKAVPRKRVKPAAHRTSARKAGAKRTTARKGAARPVPARKTTAKRATGRKATAARPRPTRKAAAKRTTARKATAARPGPVRKAAAKRTTVRKAVAGRSRPHRATKRARSARRR